MNHKYQVTYRFSDINHESTHQEQIEIFARTERTAIRRALRMIEAKLETRIDLDSVKVQGIDIVAIS